MEQILDHILDHISPKMGRMEHTNLHPLGSQICLHDRLKLATSKSGLRHQYPFQGVYPIFKSIWLMFYPTIINRIYHTYHNKWYIPFHFKGYAPFSKIIIHLVDDLSEVYPIRFYIFQSSTRWRPMAMASWRNSDRAPCEQTLRTLPVTLW